VSFDTRYTDNIVCPHCGHEHLESWEWADSDDESECEHCGGHFFHERTISVNYYSGMTEEQKARGKQCDPT
jgi:DNA-directed RNA polymerase subunit RPC12/RpoP